MKRAIAFLTLFVLGGLSGDAQLDTASGSPAGIPSGYTIGEKSMSPNGRFAILYPLQQGENPELPPNLLVCLGPYSVLTRVGDDYGHPEGVRGAPMAKWNGNAMVAISTARKWGLTDLAVIEIEADHIKQVHPVWRQVRLLFDGDFKKRFLSRYPDEKGSGVIFVAQDGGPAAKPEFEFKGRKVLLNLFADNKPNLSSGPHWTASLHAVWNLDKADFEKVDFKPGPIEMREDQ